MPISASAFSNDTPPPCQIGHEASTSMHIEPYNSTQHKEATLAKRLGRPRRFKSDDEMIRVPLNLTNEEDMAFKRAMAIVYPGATRTNVLLMLIQSLCKEARVKWPESRLK